jgi:hypothetical protein
MKNILPKCGCTNCILRPESSHGLHMIGMYSPAVLLTSRGRVHPESVKVTMVPFIGSTLERGLSTDLPAHLCNGSLVAIP